MNLLNLISDLLATSGFIQLPEREIPGRSHILRLFRQHITLFVQFDRNTARAVVDLIILPVDAPLHIDRFDIGYRIIVHIGSISVNIFFCDTIIDLLTISVLVHVQEIIAPGPGHLLLHRLSLLISDRNIIIVFSSHQVDCYLFRTLSRIISLPFDAARYIDLFRFMLIDDRVLAILLIPVHCRRISFFVPGTDSVLNLRPVFYCGLICKGKMPAVLLWEIHRSHFLAACLGIIFH